MLYTAGINTVQVPMGCRGPSAPSLGEGLPEEVMLDSEATVFAAVGRAGSSALTDLLCWAFADQEERTKAIEAFRDGKKDVLVATDVASKGLDFPAIQHVINYDMPEEIENYVHRIGRTGRSGNTGIATTFINKACDESVLMDLKALLLEAKQKVPPVLQVLHCGDETMLDINGERGCAFCGGLGHRITDCPKLEAMQTKQVSNIGRKDYLAHSSMDF